MLLSELLSCLGTCPPLSADPEIQVLTESSRSAHSGSLFVCIRGYRSDGHQYAAVAYANGCRAFVAERELSLPEDAAVILVKDSKKALGLLASCFYRFPSQKMKVIGITGTKGKTTTACFLSEILNQSGISCGYIGTNGISYGQKAIATANTTPDAVTFQKSLSEMWQSGCRAAVTEVSSQALKCSRVEGTHFDSCLFTNLSEDHIGSTEHPDAEDYKACKLRLFTDFSAERIIYNLDDAFSEEILRHVSGPLCISCSQSKEADYMASKGTPFRTQSALGTLFSIQHQSQSAELRLPLVGFGNTFNALMAAAAAQECFDIPLSQSVSVLSHTHVAGRSQIIPLKGSALAIIDYAHNEVALRQLLTELRALGPARLFCLFGSVGERTQHRRTELGQAAGELADFCILTSDNPGKEDPMQIICDIEKALLPSHTPYLKIPDRREAIETAVNMVSDGDILVLAGKGHETYQLIGTEKIPFSEKEILLSLTEPVKS